SWVALDRISVDLQVAVVVSEDGRFWRHGGVDPWGLARAAWLDARARRFAYGGSTLTMQLVRLVEPHPRGLVAKANEALLAARLAHILALMERAGAITAAERALAERTPLVLRRERPDFRAPHFVDHVLRRLGGARPGGGTNAGSDVPTADAGGGATVHTTLDW